MTLTLNPSHNGEGLLARTNPTPLYVWRGVGGEFIIGTRELLGLKKAFFKNNN